MSGGATDLQELEVDGPVAVVGDIHGRSDLLRVLLARLGTMPVFIVGDVCDRGPDTRGVIDLLIERGVRGVRGNHELWFRAFAQGFGLDRDVMRGTFGAPATLASYGIEGKTVREVEAQHHRIPRDHLAFVMSLPIALRLVVDGAPFWLVHAGMAPSISLEGVQLNDVVKHCVEHTPHELLWRGAPPSELLPVDCPVVSGHISRREPVDVGHAIAIDTGCGRTPDGRLTAVVLPERRFVTVG